MRMDDNSVHFSWIYIVTDRQPIEKYVNNVYSLKGGWETSGDTGSW